MKDKQDFTFDGREVNNMFDGGVGGGNITARNYKCPQCGGEFNIWEKKPNNRGKTKHCPFCDLEKGEYGQ